MAVQIVISMLWTGQATDLDLRQLGVGVAVQTVDLMLWTGRGNRLRSKTAGGGVGCSDCYLNAVDRTRQQTKI